MSNQKKIMIVGAGILQVPAIKKAKEMNHYVITLDRDPNAPGFKFADECLPISTLDILGALNEAKRVKPDAVMTLASDMPTRTVAAIAKELSLIGIDEETALKATNKGMMRDCLRQHKIPVPVFYRASSYNDYLNAIQSFKKKCIVKPVDNSGSRGVFLIDDVTDKKRVNNAFNYSKRNSRCGEIIVEEFMEGPEVSVETLSVNGEVHVIAITDKLTTGAPSFVEMGHSQPSYLAKDVKELISLVAKDAVKAIGIKNGPAHTEIIVTSNGPKIVELGARLGGDNITTHLIPLSTGINMVECCIQIALGQAIGFEKKISMGSAIRYFSIPKGKITSITGVEDAKLIDNIKQISIVKKIGDYVDDINCSLDRLGYVIGQGQDANCAISVCEKALTMINIIVE